MRTRTAHFDAPQRHSGRIDNTASHVISQELPFTYVSNFQRRNKGYAPCKANPRYSASKFRILRLTMSNYRDDFLLYKEMKLFSTSSVYCFNSIQCENRVKNQTPTLDFQVLQVVRSGLRALLNLRINPLNFFLLIELKFFSTYFI